MLGAIIGEIVGSTCKQEGAKAGFEERLPDGSHFKGNTIMTLAVAEWLMSDNPQPYNSFGNGSAMRAYLRRSGHPAQKVLQWVMSMGEDFSVISLVVITKPYTF